MGHMVIHVEGLGKRYRIGERQPYKALRDTLSSALCAPFRGAAARFNGDHSSTTKRSVDNHFWSLKDVSFDIKQGEAVGVIGRNGAGKSTLLKILSRITKPTEGYARIHGRVGSLLEVGTGFHPELTGRENAYLNGAIIGMKKKEIDQKFDEIVDFAEIEKFIDTPVKFYSSGMYIRLAFAVAAHLEPEILLVDEVLAVGDAAFQKKCLGKMGDVAKEGRTVLFVSHNIPMVQSLCQRGLLLLQGRIQCVGPISQVVDQYLSDDDLCTEGVINAEQLLRSGGRDRAIRRIWLEDLSGEVVKSVRMGGDVILCVQFEPNKPLRDVGVGFGIENSQQLRLVSFSNYLFSKSQISINARTVARCHIPRLMLMPGRYYCSFSVVENRQEWVDYIERAIAFEVLPFDVFDTGTILQPGQGLFWADARVEIKSC